MKYSQFGGGAVDAREEKNKEANGGWESVCLLSLSVFRALDAGCWTKPGIRKKEGSVRRGGNEEEKASTRHTNRMS